MKNFWSGSILFSTILLLQCASNRESAQAEAPRPNVILVMADDLGWGDVGFNGATRIQTPFLDALAARGVTLERFYSASAVCSPTRASCLTGRNPYRQGITTANDGHLRPEEITLPEILKAQGYATAHFGKWHLGTLTTQIRDANRGRPGDSAHYSIPMMHGYDEYFVTESKVPTFDPLIKPLRFDTLRGESLRYGWAAVSDTSQVAAYGTYYWTGQETRPEEELRGDDSKAIMDRAVAFMERAVKDRKPFFAAVWFHTPHLPVVADEAHRNRYAGLSHEEQLYCGTITAMDEQMGRLWRTLEELGVSENTLLWFCSDNGPEDRTPGSAGPYRERKRSLYEGGVRVPAFCVYPSALPAGRRTGAPMSTSDYLPSILDFLQLPYLDDRPLDGMSVRPLLLGQSQERSQPIGFLFRQKRSWVTGQYKLISTDEGKTYELYDLTADPREENNIIALKPELAAEMKIALENWMASCARSWEGEDY